MSFIKTNEGAHIKHFQSAIKQLFNISTLSTPLHVNQKYFDFKQPINDKFITVECKDDFFIKSDAKQFNLAIELYKNVDRRNAYDSLCIPSISDIETIKLACSDVNNVFKTPTQNPVLMSYTILQKKLNLQLNYRKLIQYIELKQKEKYNHFRFFQSPNYKESWVCVGILISFDELIQSGCLIAEYKL